MTSKKSEGDASGIVINGPWRAAALKEENACDCEAARIPAWAGRWAASARQACCLAGKRKDERGHEAIEQKGEQEKVQEEEPISDEEAPSANPESKSSACTDNRGGSQHICHGETLW